MKPVVGILALQGCVKPHREHFEAAGAEVVEVRKAADLDRVDALVIPGGESTTMLKLISILGLEPALMRAAERVPFWGVCAGAILMAREVSGPSQHSLNLIDVAIERNAFGRQLESFTTKIGDDTVAFIRAPRVREKGRDVEVLASLRDEPVYLRQGRHQITTFHPELGEAKPSTLHARFVERVAIAKAASTGIPAQPF